ncbi:MAG: hypothetical protein JO202_16270 [Ktedonobacteraceae bacterium]|nr:hypothetical protein [Ktedonobacteraceae bacterium]
MSNENLSYSTEAMSTTAYSLRNFLDTQWQEHSRLFMNQPASYHHLLTAVGKIFATVSGQGNEIGDAVNNYHRQYQEVYQALYTLVDHIDKASQAVSASEQNISGLLQFQQE